MFLHADDEFPQLDLSTLSDAIAQAGGDPAAGINAWLAAYSSDSGWESLLAVRDILRSNSRYGAVEGLLRIHYGSMHRHELAMQLCRILSELERAIPDCPALMEYATTKASRMVSEACAVALSKVGLLEEVIEGVSCSVDGDWLVVPPGGRVQLSEVIRTISSDGLELWRLRSALKEGVELFDAAIAVQWDSVQIGLRKAMGSLFANGVYPPPALLMEAFPKTVHDTYLLGAIISELHRRERLHDGFRYGPEPRVWLEAASFSSSWDGISLRRLLELEWLLENEGSALLATARTALEAVWNRSRTDSVYGALTILRHARHLKEIGRHLCDLEEEERCASFVEGLDGGADIIWFHLHCGDLPLGDRGESRVWSFLPHGAKGHWRKLAASRAKDKPELRHGLLEFLIAWTPRDVYSDLERLVRDLVVSVEDRNYLRMLSDSSRRVAALRAGALDVHLDASSLIT
ncbi:hypothetical protein B5K03_09515 [Rhizobium phaseoli]|uniref:hypothetical protein n=1 Tax=Rhizobium phaseoli TaxID=396 RepID=UPI000D67FFE7|nr:hypothetical protein [Rhizobium phaseoli]PWI54413.1 hypothetical protein B5K03_09515 [Rhizobium phaseoli]